MVSVRERPQRQKEHQMNKLNWRKKACTIFFLCAATAIVSPAQTFSTLVSFDGTNGSSPFMSLVQGFNGNYYGTTLGGGAGGGGTVFELTSEGSLTTIYNFCAKTNCADGSWPAAPLVETVNGTFWGVTGLGGAHNYGTIFKVSATGSLVTVHSFDNTDGAYPVGLMLGRDGNFYGTTYGGGLSSAGTVFKITPAGVFTTLHKFCSEKNCRDGSTPYVGLVQASDGNFYGTTIGGPPTGGIIFKVTAGGQFTVLDSDLDGCYPASVMVQATDGNLYGTFSACGAFNGGTFFTMTTAGKLTTLYNFCIGCADGRGPAGTFVQAADGNFYGTTEGGIGDQDCTAFEITPTGTLTTLYTFDNISCEPDGLMQATNGTFYGATYFLGTDGEGMIYSLSVGFGSFAQTVPTSAKVGSTVVILGNSLTGTTSVSFNGTAATFAVVSDTEIKTSVPTGASTGYVTVTTPSGVLTSNVQFQVNSK